MITAGHKGKALFIHVPRITGVCREIMVMPQGLLPLAGMMDDAGVGVKVLHAGLGGLDDPSMLVSFVKSYRPDVIFLTLHWHQQAEAVVATIERLTGGGSQVFRLLSEGLRPRSLPAS